MPALFGISGKDYRAREGNLNTIGVGVTFQPPTANEEVVLNIVPTSISGLNLQMLVLHRFEAWCEMINPQKYLGSEERT